MRYLIDDHAICRIPTDRITYFHIELARHDVLLAEGLPVESYLDLGDRSFFANAGLVTRLHPAGLPLYRDASACAPLVCVGPEVDAVRAHIRMQSRRRHQPIATARS